MAKENGKETLKLVHSANKPESTNTKSSRKKSGGGGSDDGGAGGGGTGGNAPEITETFGSYCIKNGALHQIVQNKNRPEPDIFPLCNFVCWITNGVIISDGQSEESFLTLQGYRNDNHPLPPKEIETETFYKNQTCFNTLWFTDVIVEPGQAKINNLTTAIHKFTPLKIGGEIPREYQYAHTGWQVHDGKYRFLTTSGALGADGLDGC
jgi:hypothetical protein